ncbi:MAG: aminomethyl-transferring glycine dehydrogenase subunit GcvPA [Phycisphaerae bacterium]
MDYTQITPQQEAIMLDCIGVDTIDALFAGVADDHRVQGLLDIPKGVSEPQLLAELEALAARNVPCRDTDLVCFLGAGAYDHFSPSVVEQLAGQSEFVTAYTPYQAEASQGSLQAFYEFQTMICQLTDMEVANASLYDQAAAVTEAVLMASVVTGRQRVLVSAAIHPDAMVVLRTLTYEQPIEVVRVGHVNGAIDVDALKAELNEATAAVVLQSPNFFGLIERVADVVSVAHDVGALVVQSVDPISCGILKRPGQLDVDIAVGEAQPLGIPLSYGGPYCGFFACREKYLRKMPGRIVGLAHDTEGTRGFCLALQTREQHIRRARATSNVCTNQGLLALRAAVHMAALGKVGLNKVAGLCFDKAHYAAEEIAQLNGYDLRFDGPFFREFVVRTTHPVQGVLAHCRQRKILAGVALGRWFKDLEDCFMVAVTEKRSKTQIDELVDALRTA